MKGRPLTLLPVLCAGVFAALPGSAHAAVGLGAMPQSITRAALGDPVSCQAEIRPATGFSRPIGVTPTFGKAFAILGGHVSKLELIRRQQAGIAARPSAEPLPGGLAQPLGATGVAGGNSCRNFTLPSATSLAIRPGMRQSPLGSDDFLASRRLPIRHTSFDAAWNRVQHQALPRGIAAGLARMASGPANMATLAAVNSWANARIRYVEDRDLYGQDDYWAGATTTLRRGAGDCEDIAIAKLQLLAALGVSRSDMFLTITRDLVRNADHAVLIVKLNGRHWLLDNSTSQLLDASMGQDYRPIMSFSASRKWLHGYSQL